MIFSRVPSLHGHYPFPRYYGPLRLPASASSRLCFPRDCRASAATSRAAGYPRFLDGSFPARCPHSPRKARQVLLPVASPPVSGFIISGGLATFNRVTRPNRVYVTLRLAGSPFEASSVRLLARTLDWLHVEQAIYMVNTFQFTRSARLILALQSSQKRKPTSSGNWNRR